MADAIRKVVDERLYLSKKSGSGLLRREIWMNGRGDVVRYNLAYINPLVYTGDHGRVLGYDSAHGNHHRHYLGRVSSVNLASFQAIEARFQREWQRITKAAKEGKRAKN
jgi:hypothetical protein